MEKSPTYSEIKWRNHLHIAKLVICYFYHCLTGRPSNFQYNIKRQSNMNTIETLFYMDDRDTLRSLCIVGRNVHKQKGFWYLLSKWPQNLTRRDIYTLCVYFNHLFTCRLIFLLKQKNYIETFIKIFIIYYLI